MSEKMISPRYLYEHPERFGGIMAVGKKSGNTDYPTALFKFMKRLFPDFPEKLADSIKEYVVMTKDGKAAVFFGDDVVDLYEVPDEVYEEIKTFL